MVRIVKTGKYRVQIPDSIDVVEDVDVEAFCREHGLTGKRCDVIVVLKEKGVGRTYIVCIEDTGIPEFRDLEKLDECIKLAKEMFGRRYGNPIYVKILHHSRGIHRNITSTLRDRAIEKQHCSHIIDFDRIYRARFCG